MQLLDITVDWQDQFKNDPLPLVTVDKIPELNSMKFMEIKFKLNEAYYIAEEDGYVRYLYWRRGLYGMQKHILFMQTGGTLSVEGLWHTRTSDLRVNIGQGVVKCLLNTPENPNYEIGYITPQKLNDINKENVDFEMYRRFRTPTQWEWVPKRQNQPPKNP